MPIIVVINFDAVNRQIARDEARLSLMKSRTFWFNQERYGARLRSAQKVEIKWATQLDSENTMAR